MHRRHVLAVLAVAGLGLGAVGCAQAAQEEAPVTHLAATLKDVGKTNLKYVTLTKVSRNRLGLTMAPITGVPGAMTVPYGAVVYDGSGGSWVYVESSPLTYRRRSIVITGADAKTALLADGPPVGTPVVTRGAAELFGAEDELGAESPEDR
jgi:hypothetical protein